MFGSDALEVAIGLIFLFFILSLLLTSAREIIEGWLQTRAIHLERGVRELLRDRNGTNLARDLYDHPLVSSLFRGDYSPEKLTPRLLNGKDPWKRVRFRSNLPAYIPARNFALALLDLSARGSAASGSGNSELSIEAIRAGAASRIPDPHVRRAVVLAIDNAKGDLEQARKNVEAWFDSGMDRVSGWYRKETQGILIALGLVTAFVLNIDSLRIAKALYENESLRTVIVAEAEAVVEAAKADGTAHPDQAAMLRYLGCRPQTAAAGATGAAAATPGEDASCAERRIKKLGYPVGWSRYAFHSPIGYEGSWGQWWSESAFPWGSIPGWLVTALAVSLGAPFWFDLLNKIMVIRSTVKPHEKSPEESSEDRQPPGGMTATMVSAAPAAPVAAPAAPVAAPAAPAAPAVPAAPAGPVAQAAPDPALEEDPGFVPNQWRDSEDPQEGEL